MTETEFMREIRRGIITILRAFAKRYNKPHLLLLVGVEDAK
jgi:hypothetical protein